MKFIKIFQDLHYIAVGLFYALLIKSLSTVFEIKIGLMSRKGRESLLITSLEPYLRELDQEGKRNSITIVVDEYGSKMNKTIVSMYARRVVYVDTKKPFLCRSLYYACLILGSDSKNVVNFRPRFGNIDRVLWEDCSPSISFNDAELEQGKSLKEDLKISNMSFFCFGIRDDSYYKAVLKRSKSSKIYNREADKDTYIRNPDWNTYINVSNRLATYKKIGIRMGKDATRIPHDIMGNKLIDYSDVRSDFGDMYLLSNCKFLISGASGIFLFPSIFNIPILISDSYNFWCRGGGVSRNDLFLPCLLYSKTEKRLLNFSELIKIGPRYTSTYLHQNNLEIIRNSEDDIYDAAKELEDNIDKVNIKDEKSEFLNNKLNILYDTYAEMTYGARMGSEFIKKYEYLVK